VSGDEVAPINKTPIAQGAFKTYAVHYSHDDNGLWLAQAADLPGAHSHGRSITTARRNITEAIALLLDVDDESTFRLAESFAFPEDNKLDEVLALRGQAQRLSADADNALRSYVTRSVLSVRDLAELLGLSFQRIHQLRANDPS
jgi:predicted RNase H-like HicB family nuclease